MIATAAVGVSRNLIYDAGNAKGRNGVRTPGALNVKLLYVTL